MSKNASIKNHDNASSNILLSLSDFKRICQKWKRPIIRSSLLCAALGVIVSLLLPVKYTSEATFYEKAKSSNGSNSSTKNTALLLLGEERENSAIVMLKSRKILESAIKKLDLQATIEPYTILPTAITKIIQHLNYAKENLMAQGAYLIRSKYPIIKDTIPEIVAKNLNYSGEVPLYYELQFTSPTKYIVIDSIEGRIGEGSLGIPFQRENIQFTLEATPRTASHQSAYQMKVKPIRQMAEDVSSDLKVVSDYKDKSFITLTLQFRSRQETSTLLNAIMGAYRKHLHDEHHLTVASQVEYLKDRRHDMEEQLSTVMQEHAEQLSVHAGNLDLLVATQQNLQKKLLTIDLEIKHIQQVLNEGPHLQAQYSSESDPPFIHQTLAEIRRYQQHCDSIDIALGNSSDKSIKLHPMPLNPQWERLASIRQLIHEQTPAQEFQGIDLETANALYLSQCRELSETEANANQYKYIIDKIPNPDFEMSSLIAILTDPVSQEIVKKASTLAVTIKDQSNRTQKELERLNHDLDLQRNVLSIHLNHIIEISKLRADFLRSKIKSIQAVTFELLQQKISLLEKSLYDYATSRLNSLKHEQTLILQQKQALQNDFEKLPEQWATEKLLNLYLQTDATVMQTIGSLIESKNISDHLEMSLSAPFDSATPPLHPKSPHLLIWALLGAFLGGVGMTFFAITQAVKEGIDATEDNLCLAGQHVAGALSPNYPKEENLETLRHLAAYLCPIQTQVINSNRAEALLLLENNGYSYAAEFAELLSKRNLKVILIWMTFDAVESSSDGLLSYLQGFSKKIEIKHETSFDEISAGGTTSYNVELLESPTFQKLLSQLRENYDYIIAVSKASLLSAEAEALLALFDGAAITITDQKLHELDGFFAQEKKHSFIISYPE